MLNGNLTPRGNLRGELTGGIFYGTMDYTELINKPSINSVELNGNKTLEDLGINIPTAVSELDNDSGFITSADIPTDLSDFTNDVGFITAADVSAAGLSGDYDDLTNKPTIPTLTSQLTNDSGFITNAQVPTMTSQLFNDSGYITSADIPTDVSAFTNDAGYITSSDIPTDVSAFTNDAGYITSSDIPTDVSAFTNDAGYISNSDLMTATASGSIATFSNGGDDIPVKSFECEIVAQQASGTPTPSSPLPITGFSQADITVTDNDQISNLYIVAFGQTIYGGRLIYANGEWSIEATHGGVEFDGSEDENWNFVQVGSIYRPYINVSGSNQPTDLAIRCNEFTPRAFINRDNTIPDICWLSPANECLLAFNTNTITTLADWKTYLSNNPLQVVYELATPVIIPITLSTRVKTISGNNNIYSNTGDCELEYFTNKADSIAELIKAFVL